MHGRLSISSDLVHFAGWRSSKFDLPLAGTLLTDLQTYLTTTLSRNMALRQCSATTQIAVSSD
jgi:hypothetical protein